MAKLTEKYKAIKLRCEGKSINEISERVNASKSTISLWCRNIILSKKQIECLQAKSKEGAIKGSLIAMERKRADRIREEQLLRQKGIEEVGQISRRDLFIAGIAIYWSEGYTYKSGDSVGFTNSDPKMILLMLRWFKEICRVSNGRFSLSIRINQIHKNKVKIAEKYWSQLTSIPLSQFNKTILIKSISKKVYPSSKPYYGTLRIVVRQGTSLRRLINGWLEGLAKVTEK